jgi:nitroimidazol reductase NimA-like FMN-containing flavoprotein (pyridoxamine 5'-phosphate oxidase superfamily)
VAIERRVTNDDIARSIIDGVAYMVLATADAEGQPWASPVWFAPDGYDDLYWISSPDTQHSRNIAARADIGMVVFDSTAEPATRQALYVRADARQVDDPDAIAHGVDVFTRVSVAQGLGEMVIEEVSGEATFRLYQAHAREHWILEPDHDVRVRVRP